MTADPIHREIQVIFVATLRHEIEERGGKICVAKMAIPKIGWLAYAADPAGNVFGIIEPDAKAK